MISKIKIALLLLLIIAFLFPSLYIRPVNASNNPVKVWFSSEYKPKDHGWYTNNWESNITFKLSPQPDLFFTSPDEELLPTITVIPSIQYQTIEGIGTSLEESTIFNLSKMSSEVRSTVLRELFDRQNGIGLSLIRICFGSSDFTARDFYTYDDLPKGNTDSELQYFTIQKDKDYNIISTLQGILQIDNNIKVFASPWSPPAWMKSPETLIGGRLKSEWIPTLAKYYRKAIQAYQQEGIPIYAMTLQNEPLYEPPDYPGCFVSPEQERDLAKALSRELKNNQLKTKLWIYDHTFFDWYAYITRWGLNAWSYVNTVFSDPEAYQAVDGVAFHDYGGEPSEMTRIRNTYPEKGMYFTERSVWGIEGAARIIQYFRNWAKTYVAWVTMLDSNKQPEKWTFVPDPTILIQNAQNPDYYWHTPEYYLLGQFSKFILPGAKRIYTNSGNPDALSNVAFLNPDNTIVVVVVNATNSTQKFRILTSMGQIKTIIPAKTVATYKWKYKPRIKDIISLRSRANNLFVSVEASENYYLKASQSQITLNTKFEVIPLDNGRIALKSIVNNKFVSAENAGSLPLVANRKSIGNWEIFDVEILERENDIALKSLANNKYVCAENAGKDPLIANRDKVKGAWEAFELILANR